MNNLILAALATALTTNVAMAQSVVDTNGMLSAEGRTLYTFDKDAAGESNCNGGCATAWPPFLVKDNDRVAGEFRAITRDDGARQWTLNENPLYFFAGDVAPADTKGDGQGGAWHVIRSAARHSEAKPAPVSRTVDSYRSFSSGY